MTVIGRTTHRPSASAGTSTIDWRLYGSALDPSETPMTRWNAQRGSPAPEIHWRAGASHPVSREDVGRGREEERREAPDDAPTCGPRRQCRRRPAGSPSGCCARPSWRLRGVSQRQVAGAQERGSRQCLPCGRGQMRRPRALEERRAGGRRADAPPFSVMANADRISPASSGSRNAAFCAGLAYFARSSAGGRAGEGHGGLGARPHGEFPWRREQDAPMLPESQRPGHGVSSAAPASERQQVQARPHRCRALSSWSPGARAGCTGPCCAVAEQASDRVSGTALGDEQPARADEGRRDGHFGHERVLRQARRRRGEVGQLTSVCALRAGDGRSALLLRRAEPRRGHAPRDTQAHTPRRTRPACSGRGSTARARARAP